MICFAAFTTETLSAFNEPDGQSPKIAYSCGDLDPHLIHSSLGQPESTVQSASRSIQPVLQLAHERDQQTDTRTTLLRL